MLGSEGWLGVPANRVVAIEAALDTGKSQVGSGYLLTREMVVTARHCTVDKRTASPAVGMRVIRKSDGAHAPARVLAATLDVAVLAVSEAASWAPVSQLDLPRFGRVDVSHSGELVGCQAVGFPLWQLDPGQQHRKAAEVHSSIRVTEGSEDGLLVMRDPSLWDVRVPDGVARDDELPGSPWGGISGALVFYAGTGLGIVTEHHPRQGGSALTIMPVQRVAEAAAKGDPDAVTVASALGLPPLAELLVVAPKRPGRTVEHLAIGLEAGHPQDGDRLSRVIVGALRAAGISPDQCERQEEGAARQILTLPSGPHVPGTVMALLRALRLVASQATSAPGAGGRAPVLMTLAKGRIKLTGDRYAGPGISAVSNMLDSGVLRAEIRARNDAGVLAMFSNKLYLEICSQGYGVFDSSQFRPTETGGLESRCWLYIPDASADVGLTITVSGAPTSGGQSRWLGAIPLAGLGALMLWRQSQQPQDRHEQGTGPVKDQHDSHNRHERAHHTGRHSSNPGYHEHTPGTEHIHDDLTGYTDYTGN
jgi:hypothetical protein